MYGSIVLLIEHSKVSENYTTIGTLKNNMHLTF